MNVVDPALDNRARRTAVLERMLEARRNGNIQALLDECTDDVSYRVMGRLGDRPLMTQLEGKSRLRNELGGVFERWEWTEVTVSRILYDGDLSMAEVAGRKTYRVTGQTFEDAMCLVFEFSGDKVRAIREYFDTFTVVRVGGFSM